LAERYKKRVGIETGDVERRLGVGNKLFSYVMARLIIFIRYPIQPVVESWNISKMLEDWVLVSAVPHDDPGPSLAGILKNRRGRLAETCNLFLCIQENESGPLAMEMKNGPIWKIRRFEQLGSGEIINSWEDTRQGASPRDQRIEICSQDPIHIPVLHEQSDAHVGPVDLRFIDISRDKVSHLTREKPCHARRVSRGFWRSFDLSWETPPNFIYKSSCRRYARGYRDACPDE
jgi:hypothetical protein